MFVSFFFLDCLLIRSMYNADDKGLVGYADGVDQLCRCAD